MEEKQQIAAIDGRNCEKKWIESGRDPGHLARFLKKYPAGFYLSWVKTEIAKWGAGGDFDNLKLLQPGRGERIFDTGQRQVFVDFLIYQAVVKLQTQGNSALTGDNGIFLSLTKQSFAGASFSWEQIRDRYYRFLHHKAVIFIDDGKKMIFGPGRIDFTGISYIGFGEFVPDHGFKLILP